MVTVKRKINLKNLSYSLVTITYCAGRFIRTVMQPNIILN